MLNEKQTWSEPCRFRASREGRFLGFRPLGNRINPFQLGPQTGSTGEGPLFSLKLCQCHFEMFHLEIRSPTLSFCTHLAPSPATQSQSSRAGPAHRTPPGLLFSGTSVWWALLFHAGFSLAFPFLQESVIWTRPHACPQRHQLRFPLVREAGIHSACASLSPQGIGGEPSILRVSKKHAMVFVTRPKTGEF